MNKLYTCQRSWATDFLAKHEACYEVLADTRESETKCPSRKL